MQEATSGLRGGRKMSEQEILDKRLLDLLRKNPDLYDLAIKLLTENKENEYGR